MFYHERTLIQRYITVSIDFDVIAKFDERNKAIELRKEGLSYNEILKSIPVAKSTLSFWLRSVKLAKRQKQRLSERRKSAQLKGAQARRKQRLDRSNAIRSAAVKEIQEITERELKFIGSALYWAEGSKQKDYRVSEQVILSNSDPSMIKLFLQWLRKICKVSDYDLRFDLYIHESGNAQNARVFWAEQLGINAEELKVYFKKHKISRRKNVGANYNGLIRIRVKRSTDLNRKISGWIEGISVNCGVV